MEDQERVRDDRVTTEGRPPRLAEAPVAYIVSAILLGSAFVALLWVPSYARLTPDLAGIPFFYWYSLLWLVINAICQAIAYWVLVMMPRRRRTVVRP